MKWTISGKTYFIWLSGHAKGSSTEHVNVFDILSEVNTGVLFADFYFFVL